MQDSKTKFKFSLNTLCLALAGTMLSACIEVKEPDLSKYESSESTESNSTSFEEPSGGVAKSKAFEKSSDSAQIGDLSEFKYISKVDSSKLTKEQLLFTIQYLIKDLSSRDFEQYANAYDLSFRNLNEVDVLSQPVNCAVSGGMVASETLLKKSENEALGYSSRVFNRCENSPGLIRVGSFNENTRILLDTKKRSRTQELDRSFAYAESNQRLKVSESLSGVVRSEIRYSRQVVTENYRQYEVRSIYEAPGYKHDLTITRPEFTLKAKKARNSKGYAVNTEMEFKTVLKGTINGIPVDFMVETVKPLEIRSRKESTQSSFDSNLLPFDLIVSGSSNFKVSFNSGTYVSY